MATNKRRDDTGRILANAAGIRMAQLMATTALVAVCATTPNWAQAEAGDGAPIPNDRATQTAQADRTTTFAIPAQPLAQALVAFGRQSGLQVAVDTAIATGKTGAGVTGSMTSREALRRLLAGTGLAYKFTSATAVTVERSTAGSGTGPITLDPVTVEGSRTDSYRTERASSPKQTAPLLDTPQTVSVIPQAVIKEQGARNLTEVLKNTPGISFNSGENGFSSTSNNFSMRGFDTSGNIFIDGSRSSGSYTRDVFNIEQVEVYKGPAADNGRGGPGGYINMATKTPTLRTFVTGDGNLGFDEYDAEARKRVALDANYAIANNTAVRLNMLLEDSGVPGRDVVEKNSWGLAPSLAFGLGTDLRATFAYERVVQSDLPDFGVPGATIKGTTLYSPGAATAARENFYGLKSDFDDTTSDTLLARLEYDFSDRLKLSNQTRWTKVDRLARYTIPSNYSTATQLVTTQTQFYSRVNTTLTNLTNLSAQFDTGPVGHTMSMGLELTREESDADRFDTNDPGTTSIFSPNPNRFGSFSASPTETNAIRVDTAAIYAYDTVKLHPQWELTGGLRAEGYRVEIDSKTAAGAPNGSLDGFDESKFTLGGKIGLVYKPAPNGSVYTAFGVAALPPGSYLSNPDISREGDNAFPGFVQGAKGVTSYNYEVGTKWNLFDDRLSTSVALFRTEKKDVPITGRDVGDTADSLKGYGEQIVQGIEFGAAGEVMTAWKVFGGLVLMDSERKHSAYLDEVRKRANAGDYGNHDRTDGDQLAFTPQVSGNLWTTYRLPFGLTIGGGMQYVGSSYLGRPDEANRIIPNGMFGKLPSYVVFNAMASYELVENVDLRLNIDNIADNKYATSMNWNGRRASLGGSRSFMLSTNFRF